jgi:hypothetical protein
MGYKISNYLMGETYIACGEKRSTYKVLVGKSERRSSLEKHKLISTGY